MRTKTLLIAAVLGAAGLASASAQVASVNAVGYVNKSLSAGLHTLSNPLSNGDNAIGSVIPSAGIGDTVFKFENGAFASSTFLGVWAPEVTLGVGEGFFYDATADTTITFVGEVLQGDGTNKAVPAGISMQGSLVPVSGTMTDHGFPAGVGDTVFSWNGTGYEANTFLGVWAPADPVLGVAESVFVDKAEASAWDRNFSIN